MTVKRTRTHQKKAAGYVADLILDSLDRFPRKERGRRLKRVLAALDGSRLERTRKKRIRRAKNAFGMTSVVILAAAWLFSAAQVAAQATYTLKATPKTVAWGYYDAKAAPVLRLKSGDTAETQTPTNLVSAQQEKQPVIYVKHLEPSVHFPPLARQTRMSGTVVMKLKIATDGTVLGVESSSAAEMKNFIFTQFKSDAERTVKTWTFGCVGCPPNATFEHIIKFNYRVDDTLDPQGYRMVMDLPDELTISVGVPICDHCGPVKPSKRGSN